MKALGAFSWVRRDSKKQMPHFLPEQRLLLHPQPAFPLLEAISLHLWTKIVWIRKVNSIWMHRIASIREVYHGVLLLMTPLSQFPLSGSFGISTQSHAIDRLLPSSNGSRPLSSLVRFTAPFRGEAMVHLIKKQQDKHTIRRDLRRNGSSNGKFTVTFTSNSNAQNLSNWFHITYLAIPLQNEKRRLFMISTRAWPADGRTDGRTLL